MADPKRPGLRTDTVFFEDRRPAKPGLRTDTVFFEDRRPPPPEPDPDAVDTAQPAPERTEATRRRAPRFAYRAVVEVAIGRDVRSGAVRDLSEVGAFVAMPTPFPVDAVVTLSLPLPTGRVPVVARAVWSRAGAGEAGPEPGMGLDFLDLGQGGREQLGRLLGALARRGARAMGAASDPADFDLLEPDPD